MLRKAAIITGFFIIALCISGFPQQQFKIGLIGFYNLENLFDTINQPEVNDEEFTPLGTNRYTSEVYLDKLKKLEQVISEIGIDHSPDGLAILGVAEVENRSVLEDLANMPKLSSRHYQIVHYDSKDERGVDVAMLYNPKYYRVLHSESLFVPIYNPDSTFRYTRDILFVSGEFWGEPLHIFVNHWPSRRGGEEATAPLRQLAASICKKKIDSLTTLNPDVKIILMGDLNDNPTDISVSKILNAKRHKNEVTDARSMYNPWIDLFKKGIGTLAYQDTWSLFDQIILSKGLLDTTQNGIFFKDAVVFRKEYMLQKTGRYRGYPLRTYNFSVYQGGYSDHLPTYVILLKKI
jgi:endonuclease/exonuclease/phosphatase family metal-dependent hydrolase